MLDIYVDADACPVKDEVYRVAGRYGLKVYVVANGWMRIPESPLIERVTVTEGLDRADDWIAHPSRSSRRTSPSCAARRESSSTRTRRSTGAS